jgi:hypothetical protein
MESHSVKPNWKQKLFHEFREYLINMVWGSAGILIFIVFLPFFAMKEMSRVMGSGKLSGMFLMKKGKNL